MTVKKMPWGISGNQNKLMGQGLNLKLKKIFGAVVDGARTPVDEQKFFDSPIKKYVGGRVQNAHFNSVILFSTYSIRSK